MSVVSLSRRRFLQASAVSAAAVTAAGTKLSAQPSEAGNTAAAEVVDAASPGQLDLNEIQGNVLAAFNKDFQAFVFLRVRDGVTARAWLDEITPLIATSRDVRDFNDARRAARDTPHRSAALPSSVWRGIALSHLGLGSFGVAIDDLLKFPRAFRHGMQARSLKLGDTGASAPQEWPRQFRSQCHAIVIVAADSQRDLEAALRVERSRCARYRIEIVVEQFGGARSDDPGHEHFGFRDGISQPGVRGFTQPNPFDEQQGVPGQDLLHPGEFVLGYPSQAGAGHDVPDAGPISTSGPAWTVNGSYLVVRRLRQDVAGFRTFVQLMAVRHGMSEDLVGAKMIGRYKSGAPLARLEDQADSFDPTQGDPSTLDPTILLDERINDFEFDRDVDGVVMPHAAHIRKVYPRDTATSDGGESDTQRHRILRRGIPFGASLQEGESGANAYPNDRGLMFLCYQSSIERQFEFVQRRWVNDPNFPSRGAGQDPVIAQDAHPIGFRMPGARPDHVEMMQRFVTTTGGGYFFQPSLSALAALGATPPTDSPTDSPTSTPTPPPTHSPPPPRNDRPARRPRRGRPPRRQGGRGATP